MNLPMSYLIVPQQTYMPVSILDEILHEVLVNRDEP